MITILVDTKIAAYLSLQRAAPIIDTLNYIERAIQILLAQIEPTAYEVVMVYDYGKSRYRQTLYSAYKGTRVQSYNSSESHQAYQNFQEAYRYLLPQLTRALGLKTIGVEGVEADDLIGILASRADSPVYILSNDHDLFQIVLEYPNSCWQFLLHKSTLMGAEDIKEVTGVTNKEEFLIAKSIKGDIGDNIKGLLRCGTLCFDRWFVDHKGRGYTREEWKEVFIALGNSNAKYKAHIAYGDISLEELFELNTALGEIMLDTQKLTPKELLEFQEVTSITDTRGSKQEYLALCAKHFEPEKSLFGDDIVPHSYPILRGVLNG